MRAIYLAVRVLAGVTMVVALTVSCTSVERGTARPVGSAPPPAGDRTSAPEDTGEPGDDEDQDNPGPGDGSDGTTQPGSELSIGDGARINYDASGGSVVVELRPTSIERGQIEDLADFELPPDQRDATPFYVELTIGNRSDQDLAYEFIDVGLRGLDGGGQRYNPLGFFGEFQRCDNAPSAPDPFPGGESYESCVTYLLPAGTSFAGLQYDPSSTPYGEDPIVWRR